MAENRRAQDRNGGKVARDARDETEFGFRGGLRERAEKRAGGAVRAGETEALRQIRDVLVELYAVNDAMNQLLLEHLDPRAWRATPPGPKRNGRTIGAIFAHVHNSRLVWLRRSAPHLKCPKPLDPDKCTMKQASAAHKKSAEQCLKMLKDALWAEKTRRVTEYSRGSWAKTWPAGASMFGYMFSHEAHHRGQILMLAHQMGSRYPDRAAGGIWWWDRLWKEEGFETRPR